MDTIAHEITHTFGPNGHEIVVTAPNENPDEDPIVLIYNFSHEGLHVEAGVSDYQPIGSITSTYMDEHDRVVSDGTETS